MIDINITIDENHLKRLILAQLSDMLGEMNITEKDIHIEVKSKQNWKSEWEEASFRASIRKNT